MSAPVPALPPLMTALIDNETGEPPVLQQGDRLIEVAGLGKPASGESVGTPKLRAQRLRQAARLVLIAVNDLAHAVERSPRKE